MKSPSPKNNIITSSIEYNCFAIYSTVKLEAVKHSRFNPWHISPRLLLEVITYTTRCDLYV